MNWTTDIPTVSGWYWYQETDDDAGVVQYYEDTGVWFNDAYEGVKIDTLSGEWQGPIEPEGAEGRPVFVVGHATPADAQRERWTLVGIYDDEGDAVDQCVDGGYFILPIVANADGMHEVHGPDAGCLDSDKLWHPAIEAKKPHDEGAT